ncbi:MAG: MMPL family transporter [Pseudolysinimonas sp.]|uniref:MMPL family transporter n=1 Tax=Pseudolysinimonas sp. TaxID=2680009 RepID=UPI0032653228
MARLLSRLGRFSARRPWLVVIAWIVLLGGAGGGYLISGGQLATGFSIPNTATQQVTDKLTTELDGVGGAVGTVVFQTQNGAALTADQQTAISSLLTRVGNLNGVGSTVDPFATELHRADQTQQLADASTQLDVARAQLTKGQAFMDAAAYQTALAKLDAKQEQVDLGQQLLNYSSEIRMVSTDGSTAAATVLFTDTLFTLSPDIKNAVAAQLDSAAISGVTIDYSSEIANSLDGILGVGEVTGVLIAAIVLVVLLGSLLPAVLPLISSLVGVGVGVAGSLSFSGVVDMASVTPVLGVMLGLAVGIDYALFIINRHRRQLKSGADLKDSIALANGTAGNAVVFAGATVLIALLALNITGIPFLGVMGTVGAVCVAVAVLVAITLTPALLSLVGMRVLPKRARAKLNNPDHVPSVPKAMPTWRAIVSALAVVGILLVAAIPALSMRLGLPDGSSEATASTQYRTYTTIAQQFGAGRNGTLVVTAEPATAVDATDSVAVMRMQAQIESVLMQQRDVVAVAPVGVSTDGSLLAFQVVPADGPTSVSTETLVADLRALSPVDTIANGAALIGVAGQASGNIDMSKIIADAMPLYLAVVIGLSILIMIVVFRSLLVPLIATGGFLLSLFAALGAVTAIFQWGWFGQIFGVHDPGPVMNFLPIILTGVLFGLAMDYQLFIGSGIREAYVHGVPARAAVTAGVRGARSVIIAAAIIMVSVFGGFIFSDLAMIRPLGFGMAIGVLFDAFLVRLVLMPALLHLLGRAAWWLPKWLNRILPNVDVEGASLVRHKLPTGSTHAVPLGGRRSGGSATSPLPARRP